MFFHATPIIYTSKAEKEEKKILKGKSLSNLLFQEDDGQRKKEIKRKKEEATELTMLNSVRKKMKY